MEFEQAREALTEIADALPYEIYNDLNGGIVLVPYVQMDAKGIYTLGHYHFNPMGLGRHITIYYGSIMAVYGNYGEEFILQKLKETLYHELTHHIEHMAGDKTLERKDEIDMAKIMRDAKKERYRHGKI